MLDFVALDFETADKTKNSACSIAVVTVENGVVVKEANSLIKPPRMHFDDACIDIHGIHPEDVINEPTFDQIWPDIYNHHLKGKIVVAHNAVFDIEVLRAALTNYNLDWPEFQYGCTVKISRKVWPHLYNHKLNTVGKFLGITFQHHQALDDAMTCAQIVMAAAKLRKANSVELLMSSIGVPLDPFITGKTQIQTSFF